MLQQEKPDDFVIATGEQHTVREFVELTAEACGIDIAWQGSGVEETGTCAKTGKTIVRVDPRYFRPTEVETLLGDATKAREQLGWKPVTTFQALVNEMVAADLEAAKRDDYCLNSGFTVKNRHE